MRILLKTDSIAARLPEPKIKIIEEVDEYEAKRGQFTCVAASFS